MLFEKIKTISASTWNFLAKELEAKSLPYSVSSLLQRIKRLIIAHPNPSPPLISEIIRLSSKNNLALVCLLLLKDVDNPTWTLVKNKIYQTEGTEQQELLMAVMSRTDVPASTKETVKNMYHSGGEQIKLKIVKASLLSHSIFHNDILNIFLQDESESIRKVIKDYLSEYNERYQHEKSKLSKENQERLESIMVGEGTRQNISRDYSSLSYEQCLSLIDVSDY